MAALINIGSNANNAADDLVSVTVRPGDSVVVANQAASTTTLNYHSKSHSGGVTGTVAAGASTTLTAAGVHYLSSPSVGGSTVKVTGGIYGS